MSHIWMSHITLMLNIVSCHTYEYTYEWIILFVLNIVSCHTYEWIILHSCWIMCQIPRMNESCRTRGGSVDFGIFAIWHEWQHLYVEERLRHAQLNDLLEENISKCILECLRVRRCMLRCLCYLYTKYKTIYFADLFILSLTPLCCRFVKMKYIWGGYD